MMEDRRKEDERWKVLILSLKKPLLSSIFYLSFTLGNKGFNGLIFF